MKHLISVFILILTEYLYILVAGIYHIYDQPNERSSHNNKVIRGGGIIFWFASVILIFLESNGYRFFFVGLTMVAIAGFTDDICTLKRRFRIFFQLIGMTCILFNINFFFTFPWYLIIGAYILSIGIINAYNFMDGINGITGLYSLSVLGALQWINMKVLQFAPADFVWFPMIACVVFLFFNFRKNALCFAGDVGSISIAFWIVALLLMLMLETRSVIWILLLAVYGVDSVMTILHRLYLKQNIFVAHRMHFYQVLANEYHVDHRVVSMGYAITQMLVSAFVIYMYGKMSFILMSIVILVPLAMIYTMKFYLLRNPSIKSIIKIHNQEL